MNTSIKFARRVVSFLVAAAPDAKVRRLDETDVKTAMVAHAKAVAAHPGETIVTRFVGGVVANSYRYHADADVLEIETSADGRTTYYAARGYAPKRPYGQGACLTQYARRAGQTQGRRLAA